MPGMKRALKGKVKPGQSSLVGGKKPQRSTSTPKPAAGGRAPRVPTPPKITR